MTIPTVYPSKFSWRLTNQSSPSSPCPTSWRWEIARDGEEHGSEGPVLVEGVREHTSYEEATAEAIDVDHELKENNKL